MSTDIDTCALISAAIESIDKVGPFESGFKLNEISDVRASRKEDIVKRAKEIKQKWSTKSVSEGDTMLKDVHEGFSGKITTYGENKLPCSTGIYDSPWIILVEGRADILNLLRAGYDNALAIEGAKIDESIKDFCATKSKVVAFLDGDRAGGMILNELKLLVNIDVELRADSGVEVEELTPQRIADILSDTKDSMQKESVESKPVSKEDKLLSDIVGKVYNEINETLESIALDANNDQLFKVAISDLVDKISMQSGIKYLILDGIITQRLVDGAKQAEIECIIGHRIAKLTNSDGINLKTFTELQIS
jgi:5S rRNA maturation endonuclease (ribonuclease M5)